MYNKYHINLLNKLGILSTSLLMCKCKCNALYARNILNEIFNDYANIKKINENQICIIGREPKIKVAKPRISKLKIIKIKKSKWKDITKP